MYLTAFLSSKNVTSEYHGLGCSSKSHIVISDPRISSLSQYEQAFMGLHMLSDSHWDLSAVLFLLSLLIRRTPQLRK